LESGTKSIVEKDSPGGEFVISFSGKELRQEIPPRDFRTLLKKELPFSFFHSPGVAP